MASFWGGGGLEIDVIQDSDLGLQSPVIEIDGIQDSDLGLQGPVIVIISRAQADSK